MKILNMLITSKDSRYIIKVQKIVYSIRKQRVFCINKVRNKAKIRNRYNEVYNDILTPSLQAATNNLCKDQEGHSVSSYLDPNCLTL